MAAENKGLPLSCPIPSAETPQVLLAHGGGGKLTHNLIEKLFLPLFQNPLIETRHDGAVFSINGAKLALSTDSYVIRPLFFPGGDIGTLAVNGTVNDLAMCGAKPLFLSAGFILEEGFPMETLQEIVQSMRNAADIADVKIITGDTKVVDKGKGDGIFINTTGVGVIENNLNINPSAVAVGDVVLLSGDVGRHGIAIMALREGLSFESTIESDCAPLAGISLELIENDIQIHCMRDLTRGGLASALNEIAETAQVHVEIQEEKIPVHDHVRGACEILGLDPVYVANEGRFIAFVDSKDAARALLIMQSHPLGVSSCIIGEVTGTQKPGLVTMRTTIGTSRIVDMLSGEQLPRIC